MSEALGALARFGRRIAGAASPVEAWPALVDIAASHFKIDMAVVLRVHDDRFEVAAVMATSDHSIGGAIDESLAQWSAEADMIGPELGDQLAAASGLAFSETFPIVAGGDLFGALILLSRSAIVLGSDERELADTLVDMTALATARLESYAELSRSYSQLKESRETLARTEHLRMLGQMAAGVSHDIKNIFNPLGLQLEVLRRRLDRDDRSGVAETIATMRDVIRHGVDIVERLREFSRQAPETAAEIVDVGEVVAIAVDLTRPRVEQHPGVDLRVTGTAAAPIRARSSELASALVNLMVNAIEAGAHEITVETATTGDRIEIAVADDGPGMSPEVERRVFEPFYTTKADGTGLGLAMIFAFVHRHGGEVRLATTPGAGSRFTLSFPIAG